MDECPFEFEPDVLAMSVPLDRFLVWMAEGWALPWIVQPVGGYVDGCERPAVNHGAYSIYLTREDEPA